MATHCSHANRPLARTCPHDLVRRLAVARGRRLSAPAPRRPGYSFEIVLADVANERACLTFSASEGAGMALFGMPAARYNLLPKKDKISKYMSAFEETIIGTFKLGASYARDGESASLIMTNIVVQEG